MRLIQPSSLVRRGLRSLSSTTKINQGYRSLSQARPGAGAQAVLSTPRLPNPVLSPAVASSARLLTGNHRFYSSEASESTEEAKKTCLFDLHSRYGGKMIPFGGSLLPVEYSGQGLIAEHNWTRESASIFDVSHMVQHTFSGPGAEKFLLGLYPGRKNRVGQGVLGLLMLPNGGIQDDCMINRTGEDEFYVVTNAARRAADCKYFEAHLEGKEGVEWQVYNAGMLAIQGPKAKDFIPRCVDFVDKEMKWDELYDGYIKPAKVVLHGTEEEIAVVISRGGYTGEDGFEIGMIPEEKADQVVETILKTGDGAIKLAGLGARDTLRLEAGMCLYGHDMDETTTPYEASVGNAVFHKRLNDPDDIFIGKDVISQQRSESLKDQSFIKRRRVGLIVEDGPAAREGAPVFVNGEQVGIVTSGSYSPTMGKNIAFARVDSKFRADGHKVQVEVRGQMREATTVRNKFLGNMKSPTKSRNRRNINQVGDN